MSTSYVDEYLVKLGATVDASGMARFQQALKEASGVATASYGSIASAAFKAQTEIVAGFIAIGSAALGLVDKVAMADQSYRLFALHMYMSKDAARSLKVAMDALGEPLENLTWDKELRDRTHQLVQDQQAMAPNGDFDAQMKKVRDIRFEFTRMEVEGQYLAMHVVQDFMKALGYGPDELLARLKVFNNWVTTSLPEISSKLVSEFMPVWKDVEDVAKATGEALAATGLAFTNFIGLLTGDESIESTTFSIKKFAGALVHVAHWLAVVAETMAKVESAIARVAADIGYAFGAMPAPLADALVGGALGIPFGPLGMAAGALGGVAVGPWGSKNYSGSPTERLSSSSGSTNISALIDKYAAATGVDPVLAHALARVESSEQQYNPDGSLKVNHGTPSAPSQATGVFQLEPGTARALGVDSSDTEQNIKGGLMLLSQLQKRYNGDVPSMIGAYYDGALGRDLTGRATMSAEARDEVAKVMRGMGKTGDVNIGSMVIHVTKPGAANEHVGDVVVNKLQDAKKNKQIQRNQAEFLGWGT